MEVVSVRKNYALNLINSLLGVVFPLITFPYITRILAPEGIGQIQFYYSIIEYIILATSVGIPLYGVREIAKHRDNAAKRNEVLMELLFLHFLFSIIGYFVVALLSLTIPKIQENLPLFLLLSLGIFFNVIGVNWFYQGIEDFKYITARSAAVKIICLILLFLLVKDSKDIFYYGLIQLLGTAGNYVFNFFRLRKYVNFKEKNFFSYTPFRHLKPALKVFLLNITTGVYTQISFLLLGFIQGNTSVGYYSIPYRILAISLTVITSLGGVLLPRLSNYVATQHNDEFIALGNRAVSFIIALILPMTVGLIILSKPVILLICGKSFMASVPVLKIISLNIVLIGLSQIYGKYMLYPLGKDMIMVLCTTIGLITYLVVGIPAIIYFSEKGAAFATVCAEMSVTTSMMFACRKLVPCKLFTKQNLSYIMATIVMAIFVYPCKMFSSNIMQVLSGLSVGIAVYCIVLIMIKDTFALEILKIFKKPDKNHKYE